MSNQQSQIPLPPMIVAGSVWFAPQAILAIDFSEYKGPVRREHPGVVNEGDESIITLYIVGPHKLELIDEDADAFKSWWDNLTGQNRIQPAPVGLHLKQSS